MDCFIRDKYRLKQICAAMIYLGRKPKYRISKRGYGRIIEKYNKMHCMWFDFGFYDVVNKEYRDSC